MERTEMIEQLMNKAKVSREVAEEALEKSNWDILDAIVYLERKGNNKNSQKVKGECGGIGELLGRIFKSLGRLLSKGNENYFQIKKRGEKPIKISLTISILLLIVGFWAVGVLLVIGLFTGYKYSIVGPNINNNEVNDILEKVSDSAESIKSDFQEGYKEK